MVVNVPLDMIIQLDLDFVDSRLDFVDFPVSITP
jgi:hypothetical protein